MCHSINSKIIRLLGEDICDLELGNEYLDIIPKTQSIKEKIGYLDY
jgi:N-formylglutamate amidohydrolase